MGNCHYRGAKCVQRRADLWVEREWQVIGKPLNLAAAGLGGSQAGLTGSSSYHHVNGKRARATNPSSSNAAGTTGISISAAGSGKPGPLADADDPLGTNAGPAAAAGQLSGQPVGGSTTAADATGDRPVRATGLLTALRAVNTKAVLAARLENYDPMQLRIGMLIGVIGTTEPLLSCEHSEFSLLLPLPPLLPSSSAAKAGSCAQRQQAGRERRHRDNSHPVHVVPLRSHRAYSGPPCGVAPAMPVGVALPG
jgi:hypothetical protein